MDQLSTLISAYLATDSVGRSALLVAAAQLAKSHPVVKQKAVLTSLPLRRITAVSKNLRHTEDNLSVTRLKTSVEG